MGTARGDSQPSRLIKPHGGYRKLKSFQLSQLVYDVTVRFCDAYVPKRSRTHGQMVQAARSGVQNIAEGSQASGTSKKMELKLTNVARASQEELRLDYEDYLRQRGFEPWATDDSRRYDLVAKRCTTVDEVSAWVALQYAALQEQLHERLIDTPGDHPVELPSYPVITANAALVLIGVSCWLLDRQIQALERQFLHEGGFTERLYHARRNRRDNNAQSDA
ncbi:MAG: four helix bundle protein [Candidatus Kapabacteria bacterium]|nr:four helix bundle protein [Candidatus Kapabacteria bacterium]